MSKDNRKAIREAAISALKRGPVHDDPLFSTVRRAKAGSPVPVHGPTGEPAYWLVPFLVQNKVCGLAEVDLVGRVNRVGILGSTPDDRRSWIDSSFFDKPPEDLLTEIRDHYGAALSTPILSYDASPSRWAWQVSVASGRGVGRLVFITPGGWYEGRTGSHFGDREG